MCLDKTEKFKVHKNYGWTIIMRDKDTEEIRPIFKHRTHPGYKYMPIVFNQWQRDHNDYLIGNKGDQYQTGFHIFLRQRDAGAWKYNDEVKKVYFREVVAKGMQHICGISDGVKVVVARERYIVDN